MIIIFSRGPYTAQKMKFSIKDLCFPLRTFHKCDQIRRKLKKERNERKCIYDSNTKRVEVLLRSYFRTSRSGYTRMISKVVLRVGKRGDVFLQSQRGI